MRLGLTIMVCFLLLLCSAPSSAIGVSPAKMSIEYTGTAVNTVIPYIVRSNSNRDIIAEIEIGGELAKYASVDRDRIPMKPSTSAPFELRVKLPANLGYAGPQDILIIVSEDIPSGGGIGTRTSVVPKVVVNFPYPGEYLEITEFTILNVNGGEKANAKWSVLSRGTDTYGFSAEIDIRDLNNVSVLRKELGSFNIAPLETVSRELQLETQSLVAAKYDAYLLLTYGGPKREGVLKFYVGKEDLELVGFEPKNFTNDSIQKVSVTLENLWNGAFENVNAQVKIGSAVARTPSGALQPFGTLGLEQYIDMRGQSVGTQDAEITVSFANTTKTFSVPVLIYEPVQPKAESKGELVIMILVIILLLGILLFFFWKRKKN